MSEIANRLLELETKVAYQDSSLEQLNDIITRLNSQVAKQAEQIRILAQRLKTMPQSQMDNNEEEAPPPHY